MEKDPVNRGDVSYSKPALVALFFLYLSQGLPYGFQRMALPLLLREHGASLSAIGFLSALAVPWMCKALWAPLVDRFYFPKVGRRKSWIIPMQLCLLGAIVVAALNGAAGISVLLASVFMMNLCSATQDIAVDGFAIDTLKPHALGLGNTAQTVGFKVGMVLTGGVLLSMTATRGWSFLFVCMAALTALPLVLLVFVKEKPVPPKQDGAAEEAGAKPTMKEIVRRAWTLLTGSELRWVVIFICTYKIGEELVTSMFNTFLLDNGIGRERIGVWVGSYGMGASITGSVLGGLLITRMKVWRVLGIATALRILPIAATWWVSHVGLTSGGVITVCLLEHVTGGMLTTAAFTLMMMVVDKRSGATEYTLLASLETIGRMPGTWASGIVAERFGYGTLFLTATVLSALVLIPWWKTRSVADR
jgi:PAT family beta-lactamase induction signal transducer AmpG